MTVLLLAGCSVGSVLESSAPVEPEPVPEYKTVIGNNIRGYLPGTPATAVMEISALRRALPLEPGDWVACVRRTDDKDTALFAVFLKDHRVEFVRRAVLIDKCEAETYAPLPNSTPPKKVEAKAGEEPKIETQKVAVPNGDVPKVEPK